MRSEEAHEGWNAGRLTQAQAAAILGVSERTFRRQIGRHEVEGMDGLIDQRLAQVLHRRAPVDEVIGLVDLYRREYDAWPIRISEGDQFGSGFVAVNPNSKIPALLDRGTPAPIRVFESGAILMHLAERFGGAFLPKDASKRAECLSWLFWQVGAAPYLGGGFGHFYAYAPTKIEYAVDRFAMEVKRQLDVLDRQLAANEYVAGAEYTIADMAIWPWYGALVKGWLYEAGEFLSVREYRNVQRWTDAIAGRPAVKRGRMVNRTWGDPAGQLPERHDASDFERVMAAK